MKILSTFFLSLVMLCVTFVPAALHAQQAPPMPTPQELGMSEEEFNEMLQLVTQMEEELKKMSPEELAAFEDAVRNELREMGIDPDTGQPLEGAPQQPIVPAALVPQAGAPLTPETPIQKKQEPPASPHAVITSEKIIKQALTLLEQVRLLSFNEEPVFSQLQTWQDALQDAVIYLSILNKPIHYNRLVQPQFAALNQALKQLTESLDQHEAFFKEMSTLPAYDEHDPYEILGVPLTASQNMIEEAYKKLTAARDPKKLEESLRAQEIPESDIKKQLKQNRLSFSLITDAYEKLHDPKTRSQIDRAREAHTHHTATQNQQTKKTISQITTALSTAIYSQQLLHTLEQFIQQYEPAALEQKKALKAAQEARHKEQKSAAQLKPARHTGGSLTPHYPPTQAGMPRSNYEGFGAPYIPTTLPAPYEQPHTSAPQQQKKEETQRAPVATKETSSMKKEKKEDENGKDKPSNKTKKEKEKKSSAHEVRLEKLINDLEKNKNAFDQYIETYAPTTQRSQMLTRSALTSHDLTQINSLFNRAPIEALKKITKEIIAIIQDSAAEIKLGQIQKLQKILSDDRFAHTNEQLAHLIDKMEHPHKASFKEFATYIAELTRLINPQPEPAIPAEQFFAPAPSSTSPTTGHTPSSDNAPDQAPPFTEAELQNMLNDPRFREIWEQMTAPTPPETTQPAAAPTPAPRGETTSSTPPQTL